MAKIVDMLNANSAMTMVRRTSASPGTRGTEHWQESSRRQLLYSVLLKYVPNEQGPQDSVPASGALNIFFNQHYTWPDGDYVGNPGLGYRLGWVDLSSTGASEYILTHEVGHFLD